MCEEVPAVPSLDGGLAHEEVKAACTGCARGLDGERPEARRRRWRARDSVTAARAPRRRRRWREEGGGVENFILEFFFLEENTREKEVGAVK